MLVGGLHFLAVIPGRAQREPGIQRRLPSSCLDPGSALWAVRDDVNKESAVGDDVNKDRYAVGGDVNKEKAHRPG